MDEGRLRRSFEQLLTSILAVSSSENALSFTESTFKRCLDSAETLASRTLFNLAEEVSLPDGKNHHQVRYRKIRPSSRKKKRRSKTKGRNYFKERELLPRDELDLQRRPPSRTTAARGRGNKPLNEKQNSQQDCLRNFNPVSSLQSRHGLKSRRRTRSKRSSVRVGIGFKITESSETAPQLFKKSPIKPREPMPKRTSTTNPRNYLKHRSRKLRGKMFNKAPNLLHKTPFEQANGVIVLEDVASKESFCGSKSSVIIRKQTDTTTEKPFQRLSGYSEAASEVLPKVSSVSRSFIEIERQLKELLHNSRKRAALLELSYPIAHKREERRLHVQISKTNLEAHQDRSSSTNKLNKPRPGHFQNGAEIDEDLELRSKQREIQNLINRFKYDSVSKFTTNLRESFSSDRIPQRNSSKIFVSQHHTGVLSDETASQCENNSLQKPTESCDLKEFERVYADLDLCLRRLETKSLKRADEQTLDQGTDASVTQRTMDQNVRAAEDNEHNHSTNLKYTTNTEAPESDIYSASFETFYSAPVDQAKESCTGSLIPYTSHHSSQDNGVDCEVKTPNSMQVMASLLEKSTDCKLNQQQETKLFVLDTSNAAQHAEKGDLSRIDAHENFRSFLKRNRGCFVRSKAQEFVTPVNKESISTEATIETVASIIKKKRKQNPDFRKNLFSCKATVSNATNINSTFTRHSQTRSLFKKSNILFTPPRRYNSGVEEGFS